MKLLVALALLLQASATYSQPDEHCPMLPADSGITWSYQQGPDFGVCYAVDSSTEKDAFGIYLGYSPKFDPSQGKVIGDGSVGGRKVKWYERSSFYIHSDPTEFSQETVIKLDRDCSFAHVWVVAASPQQLTRSLTVLSKLQFR